MTPNAVRAAVAPAPAISTPWDRIKRVLPFLGPAFVASVAYMDPGNFATNIQAGADFGYMLLWVLVASNLMAILIQSLSAKLGIASGLTLPQAIRANTTRRMRIGLWLAAEAAAMATDLAEFLGAAIGMQILFGLGLLPSALLTAVASFALLAVQRFGHVRFEVAIMAFVAVIGAAFVVEIFIVEPRSRGRPARHVRAGDPVERGLRRRRHGRRDRDAARRLPPLGPRPAPEQTSSTARASASTSARS